MSLPQFPLEIWIKICENFDHANDRTGHEVEALKNLRLVSKNTREAAEIQLFRRPPYHVSLWAWPHTHRPTYYQKIAENPSYARHVREITIGWLDNRCCIHDLSDAHVSAIWGALPQLHNIESLEFSYMDGGRPSKINNLCFDILKSRTLVPRLKHLAIASTKEFLRSFLANEPDALAHRFKVLERLKLYCIDGAALKDQLQLLDSAMSITSLDLRFANLGRPPMNTLNLSSKHHSLRYLKINGFKVASSGLCSLIENSKKTLTTLTLDAVWLKSGTWEEIFRALLTTERLKWLDFNDLNYDEMTSPFNCDRTHFFTDLKRSSLKRLSISILGSCYLMGYYLLRDVYHQILSASGHIYLSRRKHKDFETILDLLSSKQITTYSLDSGASLRCESNSCFTIGFHSLYSYRNLAMWISSGTIGFNNLTSR